MQNLLLVQKKVKQKQVVQNHAAKLKQNQAVRNHAAKQMQNQVALNHVTKAKQKLKLFQFLKRTKKLSQNEKPAILAGFFMPFGFNKYTIWIKALLCSSEVLCF